MAQKVVGRTKRSRGLVLGKIQDLTFILENLLRFRAKRGIIPTHTATPFRVASELMPSTPMLTVARS